MRLNPAMRRVLCIVFAVVFVLAGWEVTALILDTPALPSPAAAVSDLLVYAPQLGPDFAISLWRVAVSLMIGCVLGVPCGLALGRCPRADALFAPVLYILYPLPKVVLLPILLVVLGLGGAPKIVLISLTIFFQVVVVMRDAAKAIPAATVLSVRSLGASRMQVLRHVTIPATLPELFTTLRVSTAVAIAVLFIAESFVSSTGLGSFIMDSWAMVNYPRMFTGIIALAVLGVLFYELFDVLERRVTRWKRAQ